MALAPWNFLRKTEDEYQKEKNSEKVLYLIPDGLVGRACYIMF